MTISLTQRELEVLGLIASGKSNLEIGAELFITVRTVKAHVTHILDKLQVPSRTGAIVRAAQLGILDITSIVVEQVKGVKDGAYS